MLRKIPCDWFLTDGILPDVRLGAPARIMDALMRAGVVKDDGTLISRLSREWVFRRSWRYYADFSAPKTEGTRVFLEMDGLFGKYTVRLNDKEIYKGDSEYLKAEATGVLNAENRIEIEFEPESNETMLPVSGLFGNLLLYDAGEVVIMKADANFTTDMATVLSTVDAHADGEVQIIYTLTTEKGVREKKVYMSLSRGVNEIEHSPFTEIGSGRTELDICVKKDGITSDSAKVIKYVPEDLRTLRGFRASDGFGMSAVRRVGGNAVVVGGSRRSYTLAADRGLTAFENGRITLTEAECALQKTEILEELCGGNTDMLEKEAIWRLSGVGKDVYMNAVSMVPDDADLDRKVCASRYRQAVCLADKARKARLSGEGMIIRSIRDEAPVFASSAIFDKNERPRPAFFALMQAWGREHAYAVCPDEGAVDGICTVHAYYVCDADAQKSANVSVTVYGASGCELAGGSFSVIGSGREAIGRVVAEADDGPFIVVRTKIMHGFTVTSVCDTVIPINGCAIGDAEDTQLVFKNNGIENVGSTAAIGVCIPGANYFGALLPGERVEIEPGKPDACEGLNILY